MNLRIENVWSSNLISTWKKKARERDLSNHEIDLKLVIPVIAGCNEKNQPYIMLLLPVRPKKVGNLAAIEVSIGMRPNVESEKWSITFTLLDWELLHAFAEICSALIVRISESASSTTAAQQVYGTLAQWQRLLRSPRYKEELNQLRGTVAELISAALISNKLQLSLINVFRNWCGPYGAAKDFVFEDIRQSFEVKSIHPNARRVPISSENQLTTHNNETLSLITVQLDGSSVSNEDLYTLPQVIGFLRSKVSPGEITDFNIILDDGLRNVGINLYSDFVRSTAFRVGGAVFYQVGEEFPRIVESQVPRGIEKLTYAISLDSIMKFQVENYATALEESSRRVANES